LAHTVGACKCFNPGFKCFSKRLAWGWQSIVFTEFKAGFHLVVSVLPVI